jgi:hypothetical protein
MGSFVKLAIEDDKSLSLTEISTKDFVSILLDTNLYENPDLV